MNRSITYFAGLGLGMILIAGSFETSQAEEKDSLFEKYPLIREHFQRCPLVSEHLKELSLQENAKNNSVYLKPGPVKPEKVAGQFLLGGVGAVLFGWAGARTGYSIAYDPDQSGWLNFGGSPGAFVGYLVGSNLGCATGVYLIGSSDGEKGSYLSTLEGSFAGTLAGSAIAFPLLVAFHGDRKRWSFVTLTAVQSWGATLGFNLSRKGKKIDAYSEALLNLNDGKLSLAIPQVNPSQETLCSSNYKVNLFQAKF